MRFKPSIYFKPYPVYHCASRGYSVSLKEQSSLDDMGYKPVTKPSVL